MLLALVGMKVSKAPDTEPAANGHLVGQLQCSSFWGEAPGTLFCAKKGFPQSLPLCKRNHHARRYYCGVYK